MSPPVRDLEKNQRSLYVRLSVHTGVSEEYVASFFRVEIFAVLVQLVEVYKQLT
jgi:hypothetical protein